MTSADSEPAAKPRETVGTAFRKYLKPTMAFMLVLGFASGLPLMMVFSKLSFWLREAGIDRASIGGLYAVSFAYSLKFLWAPAVDRIRLPLLNSLFGQRRSWMLLAIAGTSLGLFLISSTDPAVAIMPTVVGALVLAFSGATLDIAVDAWRIESAPNDMQANMAAAYSFGYRIAYMTSGLGLAISEWADWDVSFLAMAGAMLVSAGLVFAMKEPRAGAGKRELEGGFGLKVAKAVYEPFKAIFGRLGWWIIPVFALISLYRMSDFTMGVMAAPLYSDLEFDRAVVGGIQGGPGLASTLFGLFLGGVVAYRIGMMRALMVGLGITFVTNGAYAWLAATAQPDDAWKLAIAIVGDNLAGGFVTTVFIAYLSSLVDPANAATQYALLSSFYALFAKFLSGFSGVLADAVGWVMFFVLTAAWTLPAAALLVFVAFRGPPGARGEEKFAERETVEAE